MATLAEATQNVMAGLEGRRRAQQTVQTARAAQRPGIKLPNTGEGGDKSFEDKADGGEQSDPNTWRKNEYGIWVDQLGQPLPQYIQEQLTPEQEPMFPVPATGKERIERRGWGGLPAGYNTDPELTTDVPYSSGRFGETYGGVSPQEWALRIATGTDDDLFRKLLGGGGGGADNSVAYAQLAEQKRQFDLEFAERQRENQIQSLFGLVGLETDRERRRQENLLAQREAMMQLAPYQSGGRSFMGGFEPYGAYSAVANFAGVPFNPRPIVEQPIPLGLPEEQDPAQLAQIRALLGV